MFMNSILCILLVSMFMKMPFGGPPQRLQRSHSPSRYSSPRRYSNSRRTYSPPKPATTATKYPNKRFGIKISGSRHSNSRGTVSIRWHSRGIYKCSKSRPKKNEGITCSMSSVSYPESGGGLYSNAVEVTLFSTDAIILQKVFIQTLDERLEATKFYYKTISDSKEFFAPTIGLNTNNELIKPRIYFDFSTFNNGEIEVKIYDTPPQIFFKMKSRWDSYYRNIPPMHVHLHLYYAGKQYHCQFKARNHAPGTSRVEDHDQWHSCMFYSVQVDKKEDVSLFQVKISSNSLDETLYSYIKVFEQDGTASFNEFLRVNGDSYIHLEIQKSEWTVKFRNYNGNSATLDSFWVSRGDVGRNVIVKGGDGYDPIGDCLTKGSVQKKVAMKQTDGSSTWNTVWTALDSVVYMGLSAPAFFPKTATAAGGLGLLYAGSSALFKGTVGGTFSKDENILYEAIDEALEKMETCLKRYTDYKTNKVITQHIDDDLATEASKFQDSWNHLISDKISGLSSVSVDGDAGQLDQMYDLWNDNMPTLAVLYSKASCCSTYNIQKSKLFARNVWAILDERKLIYDKWLNLLMSNPNAEYANTNRARDANWDFESGNARIIEAYLSYISTLNGKYKDNMYYLRDLWNIGHVCDRIWGTYLYKDGRSNSLSFKFMKETLRIQFYENSFLKECPKKILEKVRRDTKDNVKVTSSSGAFKSSFNFGKQAGDCSNGFVYFGIRYFTNTNWRESGNVGMVYYCRPKYVSAANFYQYEVRAVSDIAYGDGTALPPRVSKTQLSSWSHGPCPPGSAIRFKSNKPNGCKLLPLSTSLQTPSWTIDSPLFLFYGLLPALFTTNVVCILVYLYKKRTVNINYKLVSVSDSEQYETENENL